MNSNQHSTPSEAETGDILTEVGTGSGVHQLVLWLTPLAAAFFLGCWIYILTLWDWNFRGPAFMGILIGSVILLGVGLPFLVGFLLALLALRWRLLVCENGVLIRKRRSSRWIPWQSISEYYEKMVTINGISTGHQLDLRLKNGRKVSIEVVFQDLETISQLIRQHVVRHLTEEAEEQLSRGQAVDFKHVEVSRHGLQTNEELIPWQAVEQVAIEDNKGLNFQLRIHVAGKPEPLVDVPVTSFPNLDVFFHLVEKLKPQPAAG